MTVPAPLLKVQTVCQPTKKPLSLSHELNCSQLASLSPEPPGCRQALVDVGAALQVTQSALQLLTLANTMSVRPVGR